MPRSFILSRYILEPFPPMQVAPTCDIERTQMVHRGKWRDGRDREIWLY